MSWTVNHIYTFSKEIINKAGRGEYTPQAFFYFWNSEQRSYMQEFLGRVQEAKKTRSAGIVENSPVLTALIPFTKKVPLSIANGTASYPTDFKTDLAIRINGIGAKFLKHDQISFVKNSVIDAPNVSESRFYYSIYNNGFQFLPSTGITEAELDYIADCVDVVWGFSPDPSTENAVYNAGSSVQPQWGNGELAEITKRTLKLLGVHFSEADFAGFGQSVINAGS